MNQPTRVSYAGIETDGMPPVWVAGGESGIRRVEIGGDESRFVRLLRDDGFEPALDREGLGTAPEELAAYLAGRLTDFSSAVELNGMTPFQRQVLDATRAIPYGSTVSYSELAGRVGRAGAARAVGNALARNPVPIVVPCHRVIAHGGRLGGYTGGLDIKRRLLQLEGASADRSARPTRLPDT